MKGQRKDELHKLAIDRGYKRHGPSVPYTSGYPNTIFMSPIDSLLTDGHKHNLVWNTDQRGSLVELWRSSWGETAEFHDPPLDPEDLRIAQQVYISTTNPGVVKAWHYHTQQWDRFVCLKGRVVIGLLNLDSKHTQVQTITLDAEKGASMVVVPPGVAHGWKALGNQEAWILNICSNEYDGMDEYRRPAAAGPASDIEFDWHKGVDG